MNPKLLATYIFTGLLLVGLPGCKQYVETVADLKKSLNDYQQTSTNELSEYKKSLLALQEVLGQEIVTLNKKIADL